MGRQLSRFFLWLWGFRIEGRIPDTLKKYVLISAPHTSAWDFVLGILVRSVIRRKIYYLGKKSLFDGPFGWVFRWTGGYPVDRSKRTGLVSQVVELFRTHDEFAITLAPEGTRKKVTRLKTGFYHIAKQAGVPIVLICMDYGNKVVTFSPPFYPTDHMEEDMALIWAHYSGVRGKNPELGID